MKKYLLATILILILIGCSQPIKYDIVIQDVGLFDGYKDRGIVKEQSLYNQKIDVSGLPGGVYYVSIMTNDQQITKRIVKQ